MLVPVVSIFEDEINQIRRVFAREETPGSVNCPVMRYSPLDDGCLVSAWDAWNRFLRRLYLTCASNVVTSVSGARYVPAVFLPEEEALTILRSAAVRGSGIVIVVREPKWFLARSVEPISNCLGLVNGGQIRDAITQNTVRLGEGFTMPNPLYEIQRTRNYVAHKSESEGLSLLSVASPQTLDLSMHMRERTRGGSVRFDDWLDGLIGLAWDAAV